MLKTSNKLTILHDDNGSFFDYSNQALDLDRDSFTITMVSAEDLLYIGFEKPINVVFCQMSTESTTDTTLAGEYYSGSWSSMEIQDETQAFQRSGFVKWDRNLDDEEKVTIDSKERYWYRFSVGADTSPIEIRGLNIVFSDDQDLRKEYPEILNTDFIPSGETTHILTHIAVRDHIIQELRSSGSYKIAQNTLRMNISAFDLLDVSQVNIAARYLAISKIFQTVTDDPEDVYRQKADYYFSLYSQAIKSPFIDLDIDDDGYHDSNERLNFRASRIVIE